MNILFIAIGGALGSILRYLLVNFSTKFVAINFASHISRFPWGVFSVNIVGSLFAGILYYLSIKYFENFDTNLKNFLFVGFLGGFTTFSTFSLDFFRLVTAGQYLQASIYVIFSVIFSILALFFGFYLMKFLLS